MSLDNSLIKANKFLDSETVHDDMYALLKEYVKKEETACGNLLYWISMIARIEMAKHKEESQIRLQGIEQLIHIHGQDNSSEHFIPYTIQAVMQYFPNGNADGASDAGKKFFKMFVESLKANRDKLIDGWWAREIAQCNDYLKLVLEIAQCNDYLKLVLKEL